MRWAACQAVGQLCTDLGPELQEAEHARLLPGLMGAMDDFAQPRVQAHAAAALVNFSENCEQVCRRSPPPPSWGTPKHLTRLALVNFPENCEQVCGRPLIQRAAENSLRTSQAQPFRV